MSRGDAYSCWVEIDLNAIVRNVRFLRRHTGVQVMGVVKANAYGHGAVPVAEAAIQGGANWLGVARPEEAFELRRANIHAPILLLGFIPIECFEQSVEDDISITVWGGGQLEQAVRVAKRVGKPARLHLKVDTGMSRLGVRPNHVLDLALRISKTRHVNFEGIFTHFARADEKNSATTDEQENQFRTVLHKLEKEGIKPEIIHAANSAASLIRPSSYFDMVRAGISLYGLHPSDQCLLPDDFTPALTWKTILSHVKVVPPGQGISYGHTYTTQREERIGTLPVGYADGYRREPGNYALVCGCKVPVVGRVCMDQIMVNLDDALEAKPGDEVVLIGKQGDSAITAEDVASVWGTINYEVVCGIGPRVPRFYP